jgi:hypothetical protein
MYSIAFRHDLNLLDVAWTGLMTEAAARAYVEEGRARFRQSGFKAGYRFRLDLTPVHVHPPASVERIMTGLSDIPRASRIAVVTTSTITRLQIRRLLPRPYMSFFDTPEAGLTWLVGSPAVEIAA